MTLDMPTPESLEAEAVSLEALAEKKEALAARWPDYAGTPLLLKDAAIFREEAASKRAKAQRLLMKDIEAGIRTPSGTLVSTIATMEEQGLNCWKHFLAEISGTPLDEEAERMRKAVKP